ncbi:CRAL-TRIO domain-containing protein [Vararia minispora EC-137]|uniref:CRAL-TRIO domain-containing protein n=1 Tax=Vararia minispora EC-137 TaxID=1314806 RepID=A0ACB8QSD7_9AGAM|nr:CRAL-TRIO domain-containing protein [Vararia minispora EC-137]
MTKTPATSSTQTTTSAISGALGHLTIHQRSQFDSFRNILAAAKLYTPGDPPSHDDTTLLRFLRARKFDPHKAHDQFASTEKWRAENDVNRLYATFPTDEMQRAKLFYPRWTGRRDKHGVPVYVYRLAALDAAMQKELHSAPERRRYERIVALWEFMRRFTLPLCSALPHTSPAPISSVFSIIDLGGVSLGTMWSLRHHLQQASELATAHYPETLHRIAVVNAPGFFGTVWGWIKAWFDEGTRNKVHVLDSNPGPTLLTFIDAANLPKAYGGQLDFTYEDEPNLDAPARAALNSDAVPSGPVVFDVKEGWTRPEGYEEHRVNGLRKQSSEGGKQDQKGTESAGEGGMKPGHKRRWLNFSSTN